MASMTQLPPLYSKTDAELEELVINRKRPLREISGNTKKVLKSLQILSEFREYDSNLARQLLKKIDNRDTLSGDDLYQIRESFNLLLKLNQKLIDAAEIFAYPKVKMADTFSDLDETNPVIRAHLIHIIINLSVLDHMREIHDLLFSTDGTLRRIIKTTIDDKKNNNLKELEKQLLQVKEVVENKKFIQNLTLINALLPDLKAIFADDQDAWTILHLIERNETAKDIISGKTSFDIQSYDTVDAVVGFFNKLTNTLSEFFGNVAGSIKWRKGFLFDSETAYEILVSDLQPMDMLLEKSPFVLTDKFIPGHFGHVALYLGTKEQLQNIGMWEHPEIIPYQEEIENGKVILEAVRSGVRLASIEDFMNIDEITVVRKDNGLENPELLFEQIKRGMDQIGKAYDFNFDISTLDKVVCSELLYIVFGNVNWPTHYRLGRPTITPDDLAEVIFQKSTRFKVKKYLLSKERHRIELANTVDLAEHFDYELRAENGGPIIANDDTTNSFWKKETKCYNVSNIQSSAGRENDGSTYTKECKTTYKEYYYEEWSL